MRHAGLTAKAVTAVALAVAAVLPAPASAEPGQIDAAFGRLGNGTVVTAHGTVSVVVKMLRQTDGKLIAVANSTAATGAVYLVASRYLANGRRDPSFGTAGTSIKRLPFPSGAVTDAVLQPDGKIVAVGWTGIDIDFYVTRLNADGTVDPTFAPANPTTTFGPITADQAFAVALGPGASIVVAGRSGASIALARFTATGALDTTFSADGLTTRVFGAQAHADDVAVLPGGEIVVAGREEITNGRRVVVARFNANGTLDATFGNSGRVDPTSTPIDAANALLVQGTNVVIAGRVNDATAAISRYDANGTIDPTFGSAGGSAGTTRIQFAPFVFLDDLIADGSGRLVTIGQSTYSQTFSHAPSFVALARFSANGARDATFGCGGSVQTEVLGNGARRAVNAAGATSAVATGGTGTDIVVGGFAIRVGAADELLARYLGDAPPTSGYALLRRDGGTSAFGGAPACGSVAGFPLRRPVVAMAFNPVAAGYWSVATDGGVFSFGRAPFLGSMGGKRLNQPIVGMAATPDGKGYWLVARDGGIFAFGNARFYGSTGRRRLNKPIIGMAATPNGKGYWLVASDGGIFAFGNAHFYGSTGGRRLNKPIVGFAPTANGSGYWMVARDGGVFCFGSARFAGSTGGIRVTSPIVGIAPDPDGFGYWVAARDGGVFSFAAPHRGSNGATPFPPRSTRSTIGIVASP